jgi:environmental stress-induced protein Ves
MRILRAADRLATPWKNGGGVTREVAAFPPGSDFDGFEWRISIASVHADGPFSYLPGIDRRLAVLNGRLALSISDQAPRELTADAPIIELAGEQATHARLLAGPVTDLNVMTRRGRFRSRLARQGLPSDAAFQTGVAETLFIACAALRLQTQELALELGPLDAVWFQEPTAGLLAPHSAAAAYYLIELFAL